MKDLRQRFPRYSKLLHLYPVSYHEEYGEQMLQTLADMLDHSSSSSERAIIWLQAALDLPLSATKQQLIYTGGVMNHSMPSFIKRNALIGLLLLLPFVGALTANSLDTLLHNRTLYHSWLWSMPSLAIWVLWLPVAAFTLMAVSLLVSAEQRKEREHTGWLKVLLDVRRTWPVLLVGVVALGIIGLALFHDSAHCITGNPIRELHNPHQTWQCILQR